MLRFRRFGGAWCTLGSVLLGLWFSLSARAELEFETLVANRQLYSNVVVQTKSATHLFFNHAQGFAAVKIQDLPENIQNQLSGRVAVQPVREPAESASRLLGTALAIPPQVLEKTAALSEPLQKYQPLILSMLWAILAGLLVFHIFYSFCFMLICRKAGTEPGPIIWIPALQMLPLFQAAKMSPWCFLLLFLPICNLIVMLVWCFKLCRALQRSALFGLFLFLPGTNLLVLPFLAFTGEGGGEEAVQPVKLDFVQPAAE